MTMFHTHTIRVSGFLRQECPGFGGVFRYPFETTVTSLGKTPREAKRNAEESADDPDVRHVMPEPCPHCGWLRSVGGAKKRADAHFLLALGLLAASAAVVYFGAVPSPNAMTYATAGLLLGVISAVGLGLHTGIVAFVPLRRRAGGRGRRSAEMVSPADPDLATAMPHRWSRRVMTLLTAGSVGTLVMFGPVLLKSAFGLPTAYGTKPDVIGPGGTVRVWFPVRFGSVNGLWNGSPRAVLTNNQGVTVPTPATSSTERWADELSVRDGPANRSFQPWADVRIPDDPSLVGTTVDVSVDMTVTSPFARETTYVDVTEELTTRHSFPIAPAEASNTYHGVFWLGVTGILPVAWCGFGLWSIANRFSNQVPGLTVELDPELLEPDE